MLARVTRGKWIIGDRRKKRRFRQLGDHRGGVARAIHQDRAVHFALA
jgi:hypothetical protein